MAEEFSFVLVQPCMSSGVQDAPAEGREPRNSGSNIVVHYKFNLRKSTLINHILLQLRVIIFWSTSKRLFFFFRSFKIFFHRGSHQPPDYKRRKTRPAPFHLSELFITIRPKMFLSWSMNTAQPSTDQLLMSWRTRDCSTFKCVAGPLDTFEYIFLQLKFQYLKFYFPSWKIHLFWCLILN